MAPPVPKLAFFVGSGIAAFALLLLIISVATPAWSDDGNGNTIGLFRQCYAANSNSSNSGCFSANQVTQGGLSVFGLLLLAFAVFTGIAAGFMGNIMIAGVSLVLLFFSCMFIMSAYATWGVYSRAPVSYFFPLNSTVVNYQSLGYSYNLCVASHFFIYTALTLLAFGAGAFYVERNTAT